MIAHDLLYVFLGFAVSVLMSCTGIGGGSLMTPLLILCRLPTTIAIGTDLVWVTITKSLMVVKYHQNLQINWRIARLMCYGSVPFAIATIFFLDFLNKNYSYAATVLIQKGLGSMLLLTAFVGVIETFKKQSIFYLLKNQDWIYTHRNILTISGGAFLGFSITLTSIGAGVIGLFFISLLYEKLNSSEIVGTSLAQTLPITLLAGVGHIGSHEVNFTALIYLLIGSIPGALLGTNFSRFIPKKVLQIGVIVILSGVGVHLIKIF